MIAAVSELVGSRELLLTLIERQMRLRAKRSMVGLVWPAIAPIFLVALYVFVFQGVFHTTIGRYPLFLTIGLLPWTFLAQTLAPTLQSLSQEPELVRRARFPYALLPIASVVALAIYFLVTLLGLVIFLGVTHDLSPLLLPLLVLPIGSLILFVAAVAMMLALFDVYNHDLRLVLGNLLTVWFFLVPIVYSPQMAVSRLQLLKFLDPVNLIVAQFRDILFYHHVSQASHVVLMVGLSTGFFVACLALFRRLSVELPKDI